MSKKVTLKHQLPNGTVGTRTTARDYRYVILATRDYEADRIDAKAQSRKPYIKNYHYYRAVLEAGVGGLYKLSDGRVGEFPVDERQFRNARDQVEGHTASTYAEHEIERQLMDIERRSGGADESEAFIESWTSRLDLAIKAVAAAEKRGARYKHVWFEEINNGERES